MRNVHCVTFADIKFHLPGRFPVAKFVDVGSSEKRWEPGCADARMRSGQPKKGTSINLEGSIFNGEFNRGGGGE